MKKIYFLFSLLLLSSIFASAQMIVNISGQVTDISTNAPVPNHAVTIVSDSIPNPIGGTFWVYSNIVYTNANGYYSDVVTMPLNSQVMFLISTLDCNSQLQTALGVSTNSPIVANFSICTTVTSQCSANFISYPDSINPLKFFFMDQSIGNPTNWLWDFGDNTTSTSQNPTHTYSQAGVYVVCLTISGGPAIGCLSSTCDTISTNNSNPPSCLNYFNYAINNLAVSFTSTAIGTAPFSYSWDFGDNTTGTSQNPTHTYSVPGTYTVTLTTTDATNCVFTSTKVVYLNNNSNCQAMFYAVPDSTNPLTTHFMDISLGSPTNWKWDFGDNTTSTSQNPTHTYSQAGVYVVCLTISGGPATGCQSSICDSIAVPLTPPSGCQTIFTYVVTATNTVAFSASCNMPNAYYMWNFGDGTTGAGQNVTHTYLQAGTYNVCVTASGFGIVCTPYCQSVSLNTPPPNTGYVIGHIWTTNVPADFGNVYLIEYDPLLNTLTAIDTTAIDSGGSYGFSNVAYGSYLVKAALTANSAYYQNHLPTYYGDVLYWAQASFVTLNNVSSTANINLIAGINPGGPGFIGGNVTQGANKLITPGSPIEQVQILLLNAFNTPVLVSYSDVNGNYTMNNLAYGTYLVYAEVVGKTTYPIEVMIDANTPSVLGINIVINSNSVVASIEQSTKGFTSNIGEVYPNPNNGEANINVSTLKSTDIKFSIYNQIGEKVLQWDEYVQTGNNRISFYTNELKEGFYYIQISTKDETKTLRKFVKLN